MATINGSIHRQEEATDLGALWSRAVQDYQKKTGTNLSHMKATSISDVMKGAENSLQSFHSKLHKGDRVDKVRTALGNQLNGIQKCWKGAEALACAAGAFPPAMPVGILFAAVGRVLGAFAAVKADYDKVEQFFNQSSRFFERLSLLEGKVRDLAPLNTAIYRIFSAQLSICAIAEQWAGKGSKRFMKFMSALWNMEDEDMAAAYGLMQESIEELGSTVGFASYAAIKENQDTTNELSLKADEIDAKIQSFRKQQGQDMHILYEKTVGLEVQMAAGFSAMRAQQEHGIATILKALGREKTRPETHEKDKGKQKAMGNNKGDASDKRFEAVRDIRNFFNSKYDVFPSWKDAHDENTARQREMKEDFVDKTGNWIVKDEAFQKWTDGENPLLWIRGPEGIGKSFLAHACSQNLRSQEEAKTSIAYFYFKEDFASLQSVQNAFACTVLQVAETDPKYAEQVAAHLKDDTNTTKEVSTWRRFFLSPFSTTSAIENDEKLYLIFDGLDEAHKEEQKVFLNFLADLKKTKSGVRVLVTSRLHEGLVIDQLGPLTIEATMETMKHDVRLVIWHRLNTLSRLKKFSLAAKKKIRREIGRKADGMLYVEHMVRRLAYIGREGAALKSLAKLPDNLQDLYKILLEDCRRNRTQDQYDALRKLFAWLAFSKRSLSLSEASELVKLTVTNDHIDLEDEIIGRSARILELSRTRTVDEESKNEAKAEDNDNDDQDDEQEGELDEYQKASLTFQERSLRQYFKAISVDTQTKEEELRTPASAAHLTILTMCVDVLIKTAGKTEEEEAAKLSDYAMRYWHEHFNELDPEAASDAEVAQVLSSVQKIVSNQNNVAKLFEVDLNPEDVYPEKEEGVGKPWYERLELWASKGMSAPEDAISPEVRSWAAEITSKPNEALMSLARGHVQNWGTWHDSWFSREAYRFAEAVLKLVGRFEKIEDDPHKEYLSVLHVFDIDETSAFAMRGLGTKLFNTDGLEEDREKEAKAKAISYLEESISKTKDDKLETVATLLTLSQYLMDSDRYEDANQKVDSAIQNLQDAKTELSPEKLKQLEKLCDLAGLYCDKGYCLSKLDKIDAAVAMYDQARKEKGNEPLQGWNLDAITSILDEKADPDGRRLINVLKSWTEKERNAWFSYCLEYWADLQSIGRMYRAANLTGDIEAVVEWLTTFEKTLQPRSLALFNVKVARADLHSKVLGNLDKAKGEMRAALSSQPKVEDNEWIVHYRVSSIRMDLAGIIFSQFRASPDPARKEELLQEVKSLPGTSSDDEFRESHIGMLIANMVRIMGPAREYQRWMDQIFKTCIDGLEDNVSWNDGNSLRLLAKVLGSLEGLERDARITISSQFSIMDRTVFDNNSDSGSKAPSEDGSAEGERQDDAEMKEGSTASVEEAAPKKEQHDDLPPEKNPSEKSPPDQESNTQTTPEENKEESPTEQAESEESPKDSEAEPEEDLCGFGVWCDGGCGTNIPKWTQPFYLCLICPSVDLCEACHAKRTGKPQDVSSSPPAEADAASASIAKTSSETTEASPETVNTTPQTAATSPETVVITPETATATPESIVNSTETASTTPETAASTPETAATTPEPAPDASKTEPVPEVAAKHINLQFCGENHHYIKGPMKGWKGIKDGVIRIDDEEIKVKEWLRGLKEERWPKAWERYWLRQTALKDIDIED